MPSEGKVKSRYSIEEKKEGVRVRDRESLGIGLMYIMKQIHLQTLQIGVLFIRSWNPNPSITSLYKKTRIKSKGAVIIRKA